MVKILKANSFQRWAELEKGPRWFEDKDIIKTYGKAQLKRLYPTIFKGLK